MFDDELAPLGVVPTEGRGSLPFALVHGESLVATATWGLGTVGAEPVDATTAFEDVRRSGRVLVVHDPLCPLTPPEFLEQAVRACADTGAVIVGVRPVTDTVKELDGSSIGRTVAREELTCVASPVVVPPAVLASLEQVDLRDLAVWVADLAGRFPVRFLEAPPLARRVASTDDLVVLEALSRAAQR